MTYDEWKLETPEDEAARRYGVRRGDCDACGKRVLLASLTRCWPCGIETFACEECRGEYEREDEEEQDEAADRGDWEYHRDHD